MNRIGRRTLICMAVIVAVVLVLQLVGINA
jgi:hypothetical protein